jgi:hypothetical protein
MMQTDSHFDRYREAHDDGGRSRRVARVRTPHTGEALTAHVYVSPEGDSYGVEVRDSDGIGLDGAFYPYASERVAEAEARDLLASYADWWGGPE